MRVPLLADVAPVGESRCVGHNEERRRADAAAQTGAAAAGAALGLVGGPVGSVLGAAAAPLLARAADVLKHRVQSRREQQQEFLIAKAAQLSDLDPEELVERFEATPDRAELLMRTLRVADDAGHLDRLIALAHALAKAVRDDANANLHWEKAFVRVLERLDAPHLELLRRFMLSSSENGLGDRSSEPDGDKPMSALNDVQIQMIFPDWESVLPTLISLLVSQGLISTVPGGGGYAGGGRNRTHEITDFGRGVLERLTIVSASTRT